MTETIDPFWQEHLRQLGEFIKDSGRSISSLSENSRDWQTCQIPISVSLRGRTSQLSVLRALADSLGIRPDELILYAAGVPMRNDPVTTEEVIRGDTRLTQAQRSALLGVLRSYLDVNRNGATG